MRRAVPTASHAGALVEPRKQKMPYRSWIAPILVLTIAGGCAKKAPAVAQVLPPPPAGTPSFDLDSVDIRDSAGSIPLDHPPMMRTAFAVLAVMRLSAPGIEPLLTTRDIHRTVGEPHHVRAVDVSPASVRVVTWNIERGVHGTSRFWRCFVRSTRTWCYSRRSIDIADAADTATWRAISATISA